MITLNISIDVDTDDRVRALDIRDEVVAAVMSKVDGAQLLQTTDGTLVWIAVDVPADTNEGESGG